MAGVLDLIFSSTVTVGGVSIPDFKGWDVNQRIGLVEKGFQIQLDRPMEVTTDDTASISYSIGGSSYPLIVNKKIEVTDKSAWQTTIRGEGSLITRLAPFRTIIFVNEVWLQSVYPNYYLVRQAFTERGNIIFAKNPGNNPIQNMGVSIDRLFIPELPGKEVRDCDFECIVMSGLNYQFIAQYIARQVGYTASTNFMNIDVQKTFTVDAGVPYFSVFDRLYGNYNGMMWIDEDRKIIHIVDVGGDAQTMIGGNGYINLTEDSFSVLQYNTTDTNQIVDHLILTGPSRAWTYQSSQSMARMRRSRVSLMGRNLTLVNEFNYETHSLISASQAASMLSAEGVSVNSDNVFEYSDPQAEKNGRQRTTTNVKMNDTTGEMATIDETVETYSTSGELVHKTYTEYYWADYKTTLGHVTKEWSSLGVVEGGVTESNEGGYKLTVPASREFTMISMEVLTIGNFIGDTGMYEADKEEYHLVSYYIDDDTIEDEDVKIRKRPQTVTRKSMIGNIAQSWEENEDPDSGNGFRQEMMMTRREQIRFDTGSQSILRKVRLVEEFLPTFSRKRYVEDVPIKRPFVTEMIPRRWEFFKIGADSQPDSTDAGSIIEYTGGNIPQGNFHPVVNIHFPDLIDGYLAWRIARRIFAKRIRRNTSAVIRLTAPVPGLRLGQIVKIPSCTKEIFNWTSGAFTNVTLDGMYMWITGIKTICKYSGDANSNTRTGEIYTELELKKNF